MFLGISLERFLKRKSHFEAINKVIYSPSKIMIYAILWLKRTNQQFLMWAKVDYLKVD